MAILQGGKGKKLTLEDVKNDFTKYNFIISTTSGTYDTSIYNLCGYNASKLGPEEGVLTGTGPMLFLGYNSQGTGQLNITTLKPKDRYAVILKETVQEIKVKSVRNFLGNQ